MNFIRNTLSTTIQRQLQIRNFSILYSHHNQSNLLNVNQNHRWKCNVRHNSFFEGISNVMITISRSEPVLWFQQNLIQFHELTGISWWATIVLSTILLRIVITTPLTVYQKVILAKLQLIGLEMPAIQKEVRSEVVLGMRQLNWSPEQAERIFKLSVKKQWENLVIRDNCHPLKTMIVLWGQIPLWIIQSISIRNLTTMQPNPSELQAQTVYLEMSVGGFGLIPNLTQCDSSFILPITLGIINLMIIELQTATKIGPQSTLQKFGINFFRALSILMVPIAATVPAGLSLYWTTSSVFGLLQHISLMSPKIRRIVRIPLTPSEQDKPYTQAKNVLMTKMENLFKRRSKTEH